MASPLSSAVQVAQLIKAAYDAFKLAAESDANSSKLRIVLKTLGTLMSSVRGAEESLSPSELCSADLIGALQLVKESVQQATALANRTQRLNNPGFATKLLKAWQASGIVHELNSISKSLQAGLTVLNTALANTASAQLRDIAADLKGLKLLLHDTSFNINAIDRQLLEDINHQLSQARLSRQMPAEAAQGFQDILGTATDEDAQLLRQELMEMQQREDVKDTEAEAFLQHMIEVAVALSLSGRGQAKRAAPTQDAIDAYDGMRCPITNDLMTDPVMLVASGITYERNAIERWCDQLAAQGKAAAECPVTRKVVLLPAQLVPNYALKGMIDQVRQEMAVGGTSGSLHPMKRLRGSSLGEMNQAAGSSALDQGQPLVHQGPSVLGHSSRYIADLVNQLSSSNPDVQEQAASALSNIAVDHQDNQTAIAAAGAIPRLVALLDASTRPDVQEPAAGALMNLAGKHPDNKTAIAAAGAIPRLVALLDASISPDVQFHAAGALVNLAGNHPDNKTAIAAAGAIPRLVALLDASTGPDVQKQAAGALMNLAANHPDNQTAIAAAGAIPPLVALLGANSSPDVQFQAAGALVNLAANHQDNKTAIAVAGAIPPLVALLYSSTGHDVQEPAAEALWNLAANHQDNKTAIAAAGAIPRLVALLGANTSPGVQKLAAGALMNLAGNHPDNKTAIAAAGAIPPLVALLGASTSPEVQEAAAGALYTLNVDMEM